MVLGLTIQISRCMSCLLGLNCMIPRRLFYLEHYRMSFCQVDDRNAFPHAGPGLCFSHTLALIGGAD
jgi:hypothetical protein